MAGIYWLTVLPDASKLGPGIRDAVSKVDAEVKITPTVDQKTAEQAGKQAGEAVTKAQTKSIQSGQSELSKAWSKALGEAGSVAGNVAVEVLSDVLLSDKGFSDIGKDAAGSLGTALSGSLGEEMLSVAILVAPKMIDGLTEAVKKSGKTAQEFSKLGKSLADSVGDALGKSTNLDEKVSGAFRGIGDVLRRSVDGAAKLSGADLADTLTGAAKRTGAVAGRVLGDAFKGVGVGGAITDIVGQLTGLEAPINAVQSAAGKVSEAFSNIKSGDAAGAVDKLSGALQGLEKDGVGTGGAADVLQQIQDKTNQLKEPLNTVKDGVSTVTDVLGSLGIKSGAIAGGIGAITAALDGLAGPLAIIGAGWWVVNEIEKHNTIDQGALAVQQKGQQQSAAAAAAPVAPGKAPAPTTDADLTALASLAGTGDKEALSALQSRAQGGDKTASDLLKTLPAHVRGGEIHGPGSGTSDSVLIRASNGEFIVNAQATAKNRAMLEAINQGTLAGYAGGGLVSARALSSFAQGVEGQPYKLGGIDWGDCSGAVSALANYATGRDPFSSRFSTAAEAGELSARGFQSGIGPSGSLNIGWYNGGPYGGHTAATLPDGTHFEMGGARGNGQFGGGAAGADNAEFTEHMHLPPEWFSGLDGGSPTFGGDGGISSSIGDSGGSSNGLGGASGYGGGGASAINQGLIGGGASGYRAPTGAELNTARQRMDSANAEKDAAQQQLDALRAGTATQTQLNDAQQKLATATEHANRATGAFNDLNSGPGVPTIGGAGGVGGATSDPASQLTQIAAGGLLQSSGFDGSVFQNPLDWPVAKSGMAALNIGLGFLPHNGQKGGALGGLGQVLGLSNLAGLGGKQGASHPFTAQSGSPALAPGHLNPDVAGGSVPDIAGGAASSAGGLIPKGQPGSGETPSGGVDNSINFNGNVGMDPASVQAKLVSTQAARTRTTKVYG